MRTSLYLVLAPIAALSGCVTPPTATAPALERVVPQALTRSQVAAIESGTRSTLKDPYSAVFGSIRGGAYPDSDLMFICGTVNAKNSFGAYVGAMPFYGTWYPDEPFAPDSMASNASEAYGVRSVCMQSGL